MLKKQLAVFILVMLFGCQQETHEWNPIFEETSFDYFNTSIEGALSLLDSAYLEANKNGEQSIQKKLDQAKSSLLKIKDFYIPLTTIRQKIYDAERYYKLDNIQKSKKLLEDIKPILTLLDLKTKNESFDKVILELATMIDEVISTFDENTLSNTNNKMKTLGEHVNLMLYRGELVLSGIKFEK